MLFLSRRGWEAHVNDNHLLVHLTLTHCFCLAVHSSLSLTLSLSLPLPLSVSLSLCLLSLSTSTHSHNPHQTCIGAVLFSLMTAGILALAVSFIPKSGSDKDLMGGRATFIGRRFGASDASNWNGLLRSDLGTGSAGSAPETDIAPNAFSPARHAVGFTPADAYSRTMAALAVKHAMPADAPAPTLLGFDTMAALER